MKLKQAGINISIMSELKSFPWQSNYEHDYLMVDYHLRVYQRIAPYIGIFLLKILDLENKVSDHKKNSNTSALTFQPFQLNSIIYLPSV